MLLVGFWSMIDTLTYLFFHNNFIAPTSINQGVQTCSFPFLLQILQVFRSPFSWMFLFSIQKTPVHHNVSQTHTKSTINESMTENSASTHQETIKPNFKTCMKLTNRNWNIRESNIRPFFPSMWHQPRPSPRTYPSPRSQPSMCQVAQTPPRWAVNLCRRSAVFRDHTPEISWKNRHRS